MEQLTFGMTRPLKRRMGACASAERHRNGAGLGSNGTSLARSHRLGHARARISAQDLSALSGVTLRLPDSDPRRRTGLGFDGDRRIAANLVNLLTNPEAYTSVIGQAIQSKPWAKLLTGVYKVPLGAQTETGIQGGVMPIGGGGLNGTPVATATLFAGGHDQVAACRVKGLPLRTGVASRVPDSLAKATGQEVGARPDFRFGKTCTGMRSALVDALPSGVSCLGGLFMLSKTPTWTKEARHASI